MDLITKRRWIEALTSGKYKQGRDRLYDADEDSYCCLGVLCQITGSLVEDEDGDRYLKNSFEQYTELGGVGCAEFGIEIGVASDLMEMNDSGAFDFAELAREIDKRVDVTT